MASNLRRNGTWTDFFVIFCHLVQQKMCILQSRARIADDVVLVNSVIGDEVLIDSASAIVHCHLTSSIHISSGCVVSGLIDSDISVSNRHSSYCYVSCLTVGGLSASSKPKVRVDYQDSKVIVSAVMTKVLSITVLADFCPLVVLL